MNFTKNAHWAGMEVLRSLARGLEVDQEAFVQKCDFYSPSGDHLRLTRKYAQPPDPKAIGLVSHRDFGTVTVLFNWLGGLQIQSQQPQNLGEWCFVKPLAGHAIINLGDSMIKFSNGVLKSAKHRVVPAPGDQGTIDRYSVVYFSRPANSALMEPIHEKFKGDEVVKIGGKLGDEEKPYTAGEWMAKRLVQMGH